MTKITAKQYLLKNYATFEGPVNLDFGSEKATFELITKEYDTETALGQDELLIQTIYLSNDPAQKGWFSPYESYIPPVPLGSVAPSRGIGRVVKSTSDDFKEGDYVSAGTGWSTHNVISAKAPMLVKLDIGKVPHLVKYLSALGSTTLTSYFNATKYSGVKPDDEGKVWLITGAAGAAGSALVQIIANVFKPKKILAVAGGESKRAWVETLGPRVIGLDYKADSYKDDFVKALGDDKINVFADHVGGWILDHALAYMAVFGKVIQVGAIASYNGGKDNVVNNYSAIIIKRLTIQGMVVIDSLKDAGEAFADLTKWLGEGKLDLSKFEETIVDAQGDNFAKIPELWTGLFSGKNRGKYITQVAQYP